MYDFLIVLRESASTDKIKTKQQQIKQELVYGWGGLKGRCLNFHNQTTTKAFLTWALHIQSHVQSPSPTNSSS